MDKSKLIDLAVQQWIAMIKSLPSEQRARKFVRPHFEEIFQSLKDLDASFEEVEPYVQKIIQTHYPASDLIRGTYKSLKKKHAAIDSTEKEFQEKWLGNIEAEGTTAFFEFFPPTTADHDPGPKVYGSMSASEYKAQRRYADQFPILDTDELVRQWREQQEYNLDVEEVLENVLGSKDETDS